MYRSSVAPLQGVSILEPGPHPVLRRLDAHGTFAPRDRDALLAAVANTRVVPAQTDLIREGDTPTHMHVMIEGFACRYKIVEGGRRQIVAFLVPGDFCDAHLFMLDVMDHSILTLSEARIAMIPRDAIRGILENHPAITQALLWSALINDSISREWLANMGRRSPDRRIGHLLCEMLVRLQIVGLADDDRFALPITQADLGDTMGLSTVHVNRTLQELKEKKLIQSKRGMFEVLDVARLRQYSDFDSAYLHLRSGIDERLSNRSIVP